MADSPLPPHSRRRADDVPGQDYTEHRRPPVQSYFEGQTRSELFHLGEAIARIERGLMEHRKEVTNEFKEVTIRVNELRMWRATIGGIAAVIAAVVSLVISMVGLFWKGSGH